MAKKRIQPNRHPSPPADAAGTAGAAATAGSEAPPEAAGRPGWKTGLDFIVMLGGAVLAALLIKAYVMDVYVIPSPSMETALHGRPDGGDRIFSSKLSYHFRPPSRWEIAVFKFPYEQARRTDRTGQVSAENDGQNFVKRVVGMPGESMAIGRGDIWVRPIGARTTEYRRVVKPDSVQRGMWLNVYAEDFSDLLTLPEFERFWRIDGDDVRLEPGKGLSARPGAAPVRLRYRPMLPVGERRDKMLEMPGVPDRYTLRQPIQFRCRQKLEDGSECGHLFVRTLATHNIQARCPRCGHLADETAAVFYHRRSGLAMVGAYRVSPAFSPQGDGPGRMRGDDYHIVPDLRALVDFTLETAASTLSVIFREDNRFVEISLDGEGWAELRVNGRPARPEHRQASPLRAGKAGRLECYVADGQVRVFASGGGEALLDVPVWDDKRPFPRNVVRGSGVELSVAGGAARISNIVIDRDVFYYSGWEYGNPGDNYSALSDLGAVDVPADSFFPMGDHCSASYDARSWGSVPMDLLLGPALFIWWPPERVSRIPVP